MLMRRGGRGPSSPLKLTPPTPHERSIGAVRIISERPDDPSPEPEAFDGDLAESCQSPGLVHLPEQLQQLPTNRGVRLVRQRPELVLQCFGPSVCGPAQEVGPEPLEFLSLYSDMGVPPLVAQRVPEGLEWDPTKVSHALPLGLKERVLAVCGHEHEEPVEADVLEVRHARAFAPGSAPLGHGDAVALDELRIKTRRVLPLRDLARDVEEVAIGDVGHRELLDEALHTRRNTGVHWYVIYLQPPWEHKAWSVRNR